MRIVTTCLMAALLPTVAWSEPLTVGPADEPDERPEIIAMRAQIEGLEYAGAVELAKRTIAELEPDIGRYDQALVEPLIQLGDAQLGLGLHQEAFDAYDRAKHITRVETGLQSIDQVRLLYREAVALDAMGDRAAANERHELAYSLRKGHHGDDGLDALPAINDLVAWYRHQYRFRAAQVLMEKAIGILRANYAPDDDRIIGALRAYVDTYRERRFGNRKPGRGGFRAWPPGEPRDPPWRGTGSFRFSGFPASFRLGREALHEVFTLMEAKPGTTSIERANAALELADWHLLYYDSGGAIRYYRQAWDLLEDDPAARHAAFATPTPLYFPIPDRSTRPADTAVQPDGVVKLGLTITHRGQVVGRKTLHAQGDGLMEFKVRKAAKNAVYRPAFANADPVRWKGLEFEYRYEYVGSRPDAWR